MDTPTAGQQCCESVKVSLLLLLSSATDNSFSILRLIQKSIWNSSFVAEFLNFLYWDDDAHIQAIRHSFFEQLLPILALTFNFLPHKQPLPSVDDANIKVEGDIEPNECFDEEERLFNEWKMHWKHLDDDLVPAVTDCNPVIELSNGERLYDAPLGGKEFAMLIQAASQLGFTKAVKQMLELMVIKVGSITSEQYHAVLLTFLDTMLQRKMGRAILEKHESDIRSMLRFYTHHYHYLTYPMADLKRPRVECQCVRCKSLNKFLEDPEMESKVFVNETSGHHQHLLQQIQMANYRFTWDYRYGAKDDLSGEKRSQFPDNWSSKLRKRFPERTVPGKGYDYTSQENEQVKQVKITKTDRNLNHARENFQEKLETVAQLKAKVGSGRLGGKLWSEAMKLTETLDRTEISQSQKLLKAGATAKQLVDALAKQLASQPIQSSALSTTPTANEQADVKSQSVSHISSATKEASAWPSSETVASLSISKSLQLHDSVKESAAAQTHVATTPPHQDVPVTGQNRNDDKVPANSGQATSDKGLEQVADPQASVSTALNISPGTNSMVIRAPEDLHSAKKAISSIYGDGRNTSQQQDAVELFELAKRPGKKLGDNSSYGPQTTKGLAHIKKNQRAMSPRLSPSVSFSLTQCFQGLKAKALHSNHPKPTNAL
jgi:hypothetical protein